MLCAFYGVKYQLDDVADIQDLTTMADYYCALPRISDTILAALGCEFATNNDNEMVILLALAQKLRQRELFNDCIVLAAGRDEDVFKLHVRDTKCSNVKNLLKSVRGKVAFKIAAVSEFIAQHGNHQQSIATATQAWINGHEVTPSSYYRQVASVITEDGTTMIEECGALQRLLENKLYLSQRQGAFPGFGDLDAVFTCQIVADDELPWDLTEIDW